MAVQAAIFDLDGTLLDTIGDIARSINLVLTRGGYPSATIDEYRRRTGWGASELVRRSLPPDESRDDLLIARLVDEFRVEYARDPSSGSAPYPGIVAMLRRLNELSIPCAVLSNKPHELTVAAVRDTLGLDTFVDVIGARDGAPAKPDPTTTREILSRIGIAPDKSAFVGDSEIDIATARAAGCRAIGVTWGFRDAEQIQAAVPAAMCYSVEELERELGLAEQLPERSS